MTAIPASEEPSASSTSFLYCQQSRINRRAQPRRDLSAVPAVSATPCLPRTTHRRLSPGTNTAAAGFHPAATKSAGYPAPEPAPEPSDARAERRLSASTALSRQSATRLVKRATRTAHF
ncbi:hypothetical protein SSP35_06_01760 [Streptomyces sp. NBRC 110611]|nr:hypothetical protein SSP35_06_01760 [Streptomyces sp. NBRC 110611]